MPDVSMRPLDDLVFQVRDKASGAKDPNLPYVGLEHIPSSGSAVLSCGSSEDSISTNGLFRAGDTLFGKLRPRLRKAVSVSFDGCCSTDVLVLRAKDGAHPPFVSFVLKSDAVFGEAVRTEEGTKMPRCSWQSLKKLEVFCPEIHQQEVIAGVLAKADEAIEQTEALIAKMQQLKAGMMRDLFTRGVTPDGRLRPKSSEAPYLYKQSALGWIPADWGCFELSQCILQAPRNGLYKPANHIGSGALIVGQTSFTVSRSIDWTLARRALVTAQELDQFGLRQDDILITRVFATAEGVGRPALVPPLTEDAVYESNMMRLVVDRSIIDPLLLFVWLDSPTIRRRIMRSCNASNQTSVNQKALQALPVPRAPEDEQERITDRLRTYDSVVTSHEQSLRELKATKSGLMQDLLSGRVP